MQEKERSAGKKRSSAEAAAQKEQAGAKHERRAAVGRERKMKEACKEGAEEAEEKRGGQDGLCLVPFSSVLVCLMRFSCLGKCCWKRDSQT